MRVDVEQEGQTFLLGAEGDQAADLADQVVEQKRLRVQLQFAGLDLGRVEQVVDQAEQGLGGAAGFFHVAALLGIQRCALGKAAEADDGVQRRADLVADIGQKGALGNIGGVGRVAGAGQLGVAGAQIGGARGDAQFQLLVQLSQRALGLLAGRGKPVDGVDHHIELVGVAAQATFEFDMGAGLGVFGGTVAGVAAVVGAAAVAAELAQLRGQPAQVAADLPVEDHEMHQRQAGHAEQLRDGEQPQVFVQFVAEQGMGFAHLQHANHAAGIGCEQLQLPAFINRMRLSTGHAHIHFRRAQMQFLQRADGEQAVENGARGGLIVGPECAGQRRQTAADRRATFRARFFGFALLFAAHRPEGDQR